MFFKCKSHLKEADNYKGVFINEALTCHRADLLRSARQLVKNKSLLSAWSFDGRIFVKLQAPNVKSNLMKISVPFSDLFKTWRHKTVTSF